MIKQHTDKLFLLIVLLLLGTGFIIFLSASQSLLGRTIGADFITVALKQFAILLAGTILLLVFARIPYKKYRAAAFWAFLLAIILNLLVFVPHIGFGSGGARRWLNFGFTTFQPSEFLKLAFVFYLAYWLSQEKEKIQTWKQGILPYLVITGIPAMILMMEPDTGSFMVLFFASLAMLLGSGARWRHIFLLFGAALAGIWFLAMASQASLLPRPVADKFTYLGHRFETFFHPENDIQGKSYQINQSLIAIGSGGLSGRGFGQSVQKFNYLPEAIGDSIFAVLGEEFGLIGASTLVILFMLFALWGLKISSRLADPFGRLLALGIVILITAQSFINIASMLGLIPLTGVPLIFVSQGGSALLIALLEVGIVLNISKYQNR